MPWYYAGPEARPVGPVTLEELKALRARGTVAPETYVIEETGQGSAGLAWKRYQELFPALPSLPPLPPLPQVPPATPPPPLVTQTHPLFPSAAPWPSTVLPASQPSPGAPIYTHGPLPDPYYQVRSTNAWCAWGFGLSLAGIFFSLACGVGLLPSLISLPLCVVGIAQVQRNKAQSGQGFAITGLVLSIVAVIISLAVIILADIPMLKAHGLTVTEETTNDSE